MENSLHTNSFSRRVMEPAPGCGLITVIAPHFATSDPASLLALEILLQAAMRFWLLPVVLFSITATAIFRHLL